LEVVGVKTGLIFGEYKYGSTLGIKLFEVPLIIGFNWVFVILGSISISRLITKMFFYLQ
jgi:putative membrane protein